MRSGLILFVHGLGGHHRKTWGKFPALIRHDPAFRDFKVGYYSFPTAILGILRWPRKFAQVQHLAEALRTELDNRFPDQDDVTLVCHSLGGLIARRYLVDEVDNRRRLRVNRLLLYAVPNDGSGLANVAKHIPRTNPQLRQLARGSNFLVTLNDKWAELRLSEKVHVKYVVALQDNVVDQGSARAFPGNPQVDIVHDRGHRDLVKPTSDDDLPWLIFRNFMEVPRIPPLSDGRNRVTVTRFRSGRGEHDSVANGVRTRLVRNLMGIDGVDPVPRARMAPLDDKPSFEVAEKFNADYLLDGEVEQLPGSDRWTIFVDLFKRDGRRFHSLWSDRFERPWLDIQEVLKEVATKVALRIKHEVDLQGLDEAPVRPAKAWRAFIDGSWMVQVFNNGHNHRDYRSAEAHLQQALGLDETYEEALEQLGFLYIVAWEVHGDTNLLSKSRDAWESLLELDSDNAFALAELGFLAYVRGEESKAVELARRAVGVDPENTVAQNVLALIYLYLGYYESQGYITRREVVTRDPYYIYPFTNTALSYQLQGEFGKALQSAREARSVDRRAMVGILLEGAQHFHLGSVKEAERVWRNGLRTCDDPSDQGILNTAVGWTLARADNIKGARERIDRYREDSWVRGGYGPYFVSLCSLAGETDLALELLDTPETYARSYRYLISDVTLQPLAADPRFIDLLEERYGVWCRNLEEFVVDLPMPPQGVRSPEEYLELMHEAPGEAAAPV